MTYQALYRKWRPQSFSEFVGQEHVKQTLQNALEQGRLAHAYLFCGSRGTGKTSAAKIFAKAVNCERGPGREPCNQCPACLGIQEGRVMDVLEIDAASNRGIDEIRDLRDKIRYAPVQVRRKVYIIDEVHMLTAEAFNALLKTLEEPPPQVLFILATTEPHKLPATIISRCQRLDFHLLEPALIAARLQEVTAAAGRECEKEAIDLIAEEADGSLRDALSLLEQVLIYTPGVVRTENVLSVLGAVGREVFYDLTDALLDRNLSAALLLLQEAARSGKNLHYFTQQAIKYYRDLMIAFTCREDAEKLGVAEHWAGLLRRQAAALGLAEIGRILSILHDLLTEIRWSERPRLLWELAIFDMFSSQFESVPGRETAEKEQAASVEKKAEPNSKGAEKSPETAGSLQEIERHWSKILGRVKAANIKAHALLLSADPSFFDGKILEISFASTFHCDMMKEKENHKSLVKVLREVLGKKIAVRYAMQGEGLQQAVEQRDTEDLIQAAMEIFRGRLISESESE
ncbi:MAG: DNA polymerase III subunit gamma/tau [Bacillota bacterium]|jgi:DNA polymerase-3 subunit gamma/tau|nr:DNA polymerase III subunit gamma/tau [Bacillota bacterium]HHU30502.1 DNA polymerase III subunit gamma/tau [Bacillota bacterium]